MSLRVLALVAFLFASGSAEAFPGLQLDIIGGSYDPTTQTIISNGPDFTLVALLTPIPNSTAADLAELLNETYYISAAVSPMTGPADSNLGSFTWNGDNFLVTEDMTYGTPPLEGSHADTDSGDLGPHSVFPTFFREFSFQFSPDNRTIRYDSAENTGGLVPTSESDISAISYFATFNLTTSLLGSNVLHFDLYNSYIQGCSKVGTCSWDEDIAWFAPFSHDAQSENRVPEAQSLLLMSTGLLIAGRLFRRKDAEQD